jgi:UDP-N-acetylmuramate--alanine ligase
MSGYKAQKVYFIGIGGIGMSALARWYKANGCQVAGYDKTRTPLTDALSEEGAEIHFDDDPEKIPVPFRNAEVLVIYTPAVPADLGELRYFQNNGNKVIKRSEALGEITRDVFTIAVAGTHGKTTTSSMIAHIMKEAGKNCFAFLGGITQNYSTNILFGKANEDGKMMVVEADEYDRSFLRLYPDIAVITSVDPDHLDIYKDKEAFADSFKDFALRVAADGCIIHKDDIGIAPAEDQKRTLSFGLKGDYQAKLVEGRPFCFHIDVSGKREAENVALMVPGMHNIYNALAAYTAGRTLGIAPEKLKLALESFKGVKRRFEYIVNREDVIYIDDYAHHPTEINAFLSTVKVLYPDKRLTVIFQPHLYSRTRDFMEEFAESLSLADSLILLEIYPAREKPISGISSATLLERVKSKEKTVLPKEDLTAYMRNKRPELIVTMGAGDIDQLVSPLRKIFLQE